MRKVRTLRHWKQRFDENAEFVFRKAVTYATVEFKAGDPIPEDLKNKTTKLRRFWESNVVELAQFEEPNVKTGVVDKPAMANKVEALEVTRDGRNYVVGDQKFTSMKKAKAFVDAQSLKTEAPDSTDGSGADTVAGGTEDGTDDDFLG